MEKKMGSGLVVVLLGVLCWSITTLHAAQVELPEGARDLLQYGSGGHIIGFMPGKIYLASVDHALSVEFVGCGSTRPHGIDPVATGGGKGPKPLGLVEYRELWPGIDLRFEKADQGVAESTYELRAGADVSRIRLKYNVPVALRDDGALTFRFRSGDLTESAPVAWQEISGTRHPIKVAFVVSEGTVGFKVGRYDRNRPLVIDPTYQWHTFYGSSVDDEGATAIALDGSGNIYVTGASGATWNGPSGQTPLNPHSSSGFALDVFVLKLDSSGTYQWHTFFGYAIGYAVSVDSGGNVFVAGSSPDTWNGPSGQPPLHPRSKSNTSFWDIFILKLNNNGAYQWHTFYGSSSDYDQTARGIATDSGGNVCVTGYTDAAWNGDGGTAPLHPYGGSSDSFVIKLNAGGVYQWHTFYGSGSSDYARGIALDAAGGLYVAGTSLDTWNGPAGQAALHSFGGSADLFVLKLGSNGVYQWHTFYGDSDDGHAIALDKSGNIYVTGSSGYTWDGPSGQGPLHAHSADTFDIHVLKLNSSGAYQWHTFYEANNHSYKYGIAAGGANSVYVTGLSNAAWSGDGGAAPLHPFNGSSDTYILKLNTSGIYRWHTFYGSDDPIYGNNGIAVDGVGNVLTTGYTATSWNGDGDAPPLNAYGGGWDIFVLKMKDHPTYHADFDGDGKSDITVWRPDGGNWFTINSKTGTRSVTGFGTSGDVPVPGDYDGDGTADRAVFRPSGNTWFIRNSATGTDGVVSYGASGDSPVSGDYDGDGKTDVAVFRPTSGTWFIRNSATSTQSAVSYGTSGDVPVPGDYDGDGKTDVAVFRPTSNTWFIRNSATSTQSAVSYGTSGDVPVPGDYDGDGKTDVAVFRPASGTWFIVNSSNNSQRAVNFGASGDTPVPGDYDGDGRADAAVFRPANGIWFIQQSSTGMTSVVSWGTSTDVPIK